MTPQTVFMFGLPVNCLSIDSRESKSCFEAHGIICTLKSKATSLFLLQSSIPSLPLFGEKLFIQFISTGDLNKASSLNCHLQSSRFSVRSLEIPSRNISYYETNRVFEIFLGVWSIDLYRNYRGVFCRYDAVANAPWVFPEIMAKITSRFSIFFSNS